MHGCDTARVVHKPRLLSDNGSSYLSGDLAEWLADRGMGHVRGAPHHPQTQGKIERWHQTLKNRILLENYYLPGDLEAHIARFVAHYNHRRYHESLNNLTPAEPSTAGAAAPSCSNVKGSNDRHSPYVACTTSNKPRNIIKQTSQNLPCSAPRAVSKTLTTDSLFHS